MIMAKEALNNEHSSLSFGIGNGKTPWMEEPGGLWSMGSRRVGHD